MKLLLTLVIWLVVAVALLGGGWLAFAHYQQAAAVAAIPPPAPPPADVVVKTLREEKTTLWTSFSGRLHAVDQADVRPEVSGRITEIHFQDGQEVKAGDVLVVIDPRPFAAAVQRSQADVTSAQSKVELAKVDQSRAAGLINSHAIAQSELDKVNDEFRSAAASEQAAEAMLVQAKLDLEHSSVMAPIAGRVSRAEITVGNLVPSGPSAPVLTTIVSDNGIYADFEVDEQTYLQTIRGTASNQSQEARVPVQVVAQGDEGHPYDGFIESFDNRIDPASGTIRARARFANADHALVPGMFVSVRLAGAQSESLLLVPEQAISFDQSKKYVFVVDEAGKADYREVTLGAGIDGQRVVTSGLKAGDRVVVDGIQHVHPGDTVNAHEASPGPADLVTSAKPAGE